MKSHTVSPAHRGLLAFVLTIDPAARKQYVHLIRMGAKNIRPDSMLVRQTDGTYERMPDPSAWNFNVHVGGTEGGLEGRHSLSACLIRHRDGEWSIHS